MANSHDFTFFFLFQSTNSIYFVSVNRYTPFSFNANFFHSRQRCKWIFWYQQRHLAVTSRMWFGSAISYHNRNSYTTHYHESDRNKHIVILSGFDKRIMYDYTLHRRASQRTTRVRLLQRSGQSIQEVVLSFVAVNLSLKRCGNAGKFMY